MPTTSATLAVGLLGLSAIPPGLGFASLWLLFQAILAAPRTGGLLFQLPLALIGAAIALSAALATAGSVRLIGIAVLGRPRTPRGAGARESQSPVRAILLALAALSALAGVLPGTALWGLADPAIRALTGARYQVGVGIALHHGAGLPGASRARAAGAGDRRRDAGDALVAQGGQNRRSLGRAACSRPSACPFGEPVAQSAGEGFLPPLPEIALPQRRRLLPAFPTLRPPSADAGLWLVLAAFGALLLVLGVVG